MALLVIGTLTLAIISILFGVLVLAFPEFLRVIIGTYFILMGVIALLAL